MHRLIEGAALGEAQDDAAGHQRRVQGDDGIGRSAGLPQHLLEPRCGLLQSVGERDDFDVGRLQAREVGKIGAKLPVDEDQPIGGKRGDAGGERMGKLVLAETPCLPDVPVGRLPSAANGDRCISKPPPDGGADRACRKSRWPGGEARRPICRAAPGSVVSAAVKASRNACSARVWNCLTGNSMLRGLATGGLVAAKLGVTGLLELERELGAAGAGDPAAGEHMHPVRHDIVEQPLVMGDDEHGAIR